MESKSPTHRALTLADVAGYAGGALGAEIVSAAELSGGGFAAVWKARLGDGRDVGPTSSSAAPTWS